MTASPADRVGWCPGALRPMPSGDGFIVRVKPRCATLSPAQAIGIAAAATAFGNGALDLTSHANLQVRGATDASLASLTAALDRLGLLDPDVGAETRRNVTVSPLAGLDPMALLDIRPIVAALETRLVTDVGLAELPAKFGFAVSDGGRLRLDDVGADVTFDGGWRSLPETGRVARSAGWGRGELHVRPEGSPATPPDTLRVPPSPSRGGIAQPRDCDSDRTPSFTVRLAGAEDIVAICPASSVPDVAARLAGWFIAARAADPDLRRMLHAVARSGAAAILAAVGLRAEVGSQPSVHPQPSWPGLSRPPTPEGIARRSGEEEWSFGVGSLSLWDGVGGRDEPGHDGGAAEACHVLGVAAPFGRLAAAQLDQLARGALRAGASELRVAPWRAILVPGLTRPAAERLAEECTAAGLITDPSDPRLRVAACPGAPGCHRGTTPVLDHAAGWAALLKPGPRDHGILLHVSGCAKGCAHPATAPLTLVAEDGRYRLVSRGRPGPAGLDPDAVRSLLGAAGEGGPT